MHSLPEKLNLALQYELKVGEIISWSCRPNSFYSMLSATPIFLFGIPWNAFLFYMHEKRLNNLESIYLDIFVIPFYLAGVYFFAAPFIEWYKARRTVYVITNKRAFTIKNFKSVSVESFYPKSIGNIEKTIRRNGSGNIILARHHHTDSDNDPQITDYGFFSLPNVIEAEIYLDKLINA